MSDRSVDNMRSLMKISMSFTLLFLMSTSILAPHGKADLSNTDFSHLTYSDPQGDDYTFNWNGKIDGFDIEYKDSSGKTGKNPSLDIVSLRATLSGDTVTVTLECAGNVQLAHDTDYLVFFVESDHDPSKYSNFKILLELEDYKRSSINYEYMDEPNSIVYFGYSHVTDQEDAAGNIYLPSLEGSVTGKKVTLSISTSDLEDAGVTTGSGFGLYAFTNKIQSSGDSYKAVWDSAGLGAVSAPDEFSSSGEDTSDDWVWGLLCLFIIIIVVIIIIVLVMYLLKKKRQTPPLYPQYPYPPPQYPPQRQYPQYPPPQYPPQHQYPQYPPPQYPPQHQYPQYPPPQYPPHQGYQR